MKKGIVQKHNEETTQREVNCSSDSFSGQVENREDVITADTALNQKERDVNLTQGEKGQESLMNEENTKNQESEIDAISPQMQDNDAADAVIGVQHKKKVNGKMATAYLTKLAILTALSFLMYYFVKFPLPFMFPAFLDMQISELPALLAGFSMGPTAGALVIIIKCVIKMPLSGTACVGEIVDIIIGLSLVLPASLIYKRRKNLKNAVIGFSVGIVASVVVAMLANRFISIPLYINLFFHGNWNILLNICRPLYPAITKENFYAYYIFVAVLPFNILRSAVTALLTFILYKRLSKILHWEGQTINLYATLPYPKTPVIYNVKSEKEMSRLAAHFAKALKGGERIILEGELGAGKTTFTKGLAKALGVKERVTSPTFTILNVYESGRVPLYHLDMYRIDSESDIYETGILDVISDGGVTVIEWNKLDENCKACIIKIERTGETARRLEVLTHEVSSI